MSISKTELTRFRNHMVRAAKEAGVDLEMGTITFNEGYFKFSAKGYVIGGQGKYEEFCKYANRKNVPISYFERTFTTNKNERMMITGIKPRGRTNVLEITDLDSGKKYSASISYVKQFKLDAPYRNNDEKPIYPLGLTHK